MVAGFSSKDDMSEKGLTRPRKKSTQTMEKENGQEKAKENMAEERRKAKPKDMKRKTAASTEAKAKRKEKQKEKERTESHRSRQAMVIPPRILEQRQRLTVSNRTRLAQPLLKKMPAIVLRPRV